MRTYAGVEIQIHELISSSLDGGERLASCPDNFTPARILRYALGMILCGFQITYEFSREKKKILASSGNRKPINQLH